MVGGIIVYGLAIVGLFIFIKDAYARSLIHKEKAKIKDEKKKAKKEMKKAKKEMKKKYKAEKKKLKLDLKNAVTESDKDEG